MVRIEAIERGLGHEAAVAGGGDAPAARAAVAVVLRERGLDDSGVPAAEVLIIRRAERAGDPWSGHAAFPGGRVSPADASIEETAIREAREELGIDLAAPGVRRLGRMRDFAPMRRSGISVTPILFEVRGDPPLAPDPREVAAAYWVPLAALRSGRHDARYLYWWWRPVWSRVAFPVPLLLSCWRWRGLTIWGLTYRMLLEMFRMAGSAP